MMQEHQKGCQPMAKKLTFTAEDFEAQIAVFKQSSADARAAARLCADMSIQHFEVHGDTTYCNRFLEAMTKNFDRADPYLKWLREFAPIKVEKEKIVKDTSEAAMARHSENADEAGFNIAGALATPYWEVSPEKVVKSFDSTDVFEKARAGLRGFRNGNSMQPLDEQALNAVGFIEDAINEAERKMKLAKVNNSRAGVNGGGEDGLQPAIANNNEGAEPVVHQS